MAPQTPNDPADEGRALRLSDLAAAIEARRGETGEVKVPRNAGGGRTAAKTGLLAAVAATGGLW